MSNWMLVAIGAVVLFFFLSFIVESIMGAIALVVIIALAGGGLSSAFGDFNPFTWLAAPIKKGQSDIQQLGCSAEKDSIVFGDTDRCTSYKIALKRCEKRSTEDSKKRCKTKAEDKFNKSVVDGN